LKRRRKLTFKPAPEISKNKMRLNCEDQNHL
jgi:hypothetical protein